MGFQLTSEGIVTSDITEQIVVDVAGPGRYSGYIDLNEMQNGDTTAIRLYVLINGIWRCYHTDNYTDQQTDPLLYIAPKESVTEVKLTLQLVAGNPHNYPYQFILDTEGGAGAAHFRV